eukprot:Sspe_Gene.54867::Locus_30231_Transcript_1_1_Confidence_1.000_Length_2076::g.54867::m.54867
MYVGRCTWLNDIRPRRRKKQQSPIEDSSSPKLPRALHHELLAPFSAGDIRVRAESRGTSERTTEAVSPVQPSTPIPSPWSPMSGKQQPLQVPSPITSARSDRHREPTAAPHPTDAVLQEKRRDKGAAVRRRRKGAARLKPQHSYGVVPSQTAEHLAHKVRKLLTPEALSEGSVEELLSHFLLLVHHHTTEMATLPRPLLSSLLTILAYSCSLGVAWAVTSLVLITAMLLEAPTAVADAFRECLVQGCFTVPDTGLYALLATMEPCELQQRLELLAKLLVELEVIHPDELLSGLKGVRYSVNADSLPCSESHRGVAGLAADSISSHWVVAQLTPWLRAEYYVAPPSGVQMSTAYSLYVAAVEGLASHFVSVDLAFPPMHTHLPLRLCELHIGNRHGREGVTRCWATLKILTTHANVVTEDQSAEAAITVEVASLPQDIAVQAGVGSRDPAVVSVADAYNGLHVALCQCWGIAEEDFLSVVGEPESYGGRRGILLSKVPDVVKFEYEACISISVPLVLSPNIPHVAINVWITDHGPQARKGLPVCITLHSVKITEACGLDVNTFLAQQSPALRSQSWWHSEEQVTSACRPQVSTTGLKRSVHVDVRGKLAFRHLELEEAV